MDRFQHIADIAEILYRQGIKDVIISPGSRNAPLIKAFYKRFGNRCKSIVDERSAAYFALGKSLKSKIPTVLISTSGTAALNYAPAVAEAFHQKVPLIFLTADRPVEWIDQQDNQSIQQNNIYGKNIKSSYSLPVETVKYDDLWFVHRIINQAFITSISDTQGPVHINIPLREPLYESLPEPSSELKIISREKPISELSVEGWMSKQWRKASSIMIIAGQIQPDKELKDLIGKITKDYRVVLIAEPVSNLHECATISSPEIVLNSKIKYPEISNPEIVIYIGGQIVSKKIKLFLRNLKDSTFFTFSKSENVVDTFQNLDVILNTDPISAFKSLKKSDNKVITPFKKFWAEENKKSKKYIKEYFFQIPFSDLQVFKSLSECLPDDAIIFAGNSSVVRYLLYFDQKNRRFYSNRGVSGIDGCLSTAAGLASNTKETVYAIVGDLTFVYDSNAFWNRELPVNLKIILINNQGGGIFHLLKGPSDSNAFMPFVNAFHPVDFQKLSEAFGLKHHIITTENQLKNMIKKLSDSENTETLEIRTPNFGNPKITKDLFKFLNKNYGKKLGNN